MNWAESFAIVGTAWGLFAVVATTLGNIVELEKANTEQIKENNKQEQWRHNIGHCQEENEE